MNKIESEAQKIINNYSADLIRKRYHVSPIVRSTYNYEIVIGTLNQKVKLLVYFGKKGNKILLQGNSENKLYKKIHDDIFGTALFSEAHEIETEPAKYIGTDESGKGDYFGPLVICGVMMNDSLSNYFKQIGVKDSKLLDDHSIMLIAEKLKKALGNKFAVIKLKPEKYNELQKEFGNINKMLGWGHSQVIQKLLQIEKSPLAICDKFGKPDHINKYFDKNKFEVKIFQYTKAERFLGVAAASIIARAEVVNWFKLASEKLQFNIPLGASAAVDKAASEMKNIYGSEFLSKLVKLHFKNSLKII